MAGFPPAQPIESTPWQQGYSAGYSAAMVYTRYLVGKLGERLADFDPDEEIPF